jgi:hypothetical protein
MNAQKILSFAPMVIVKTSWVDINARVSMALSQAMI